MDSVRLTCVRHGETRHNIEGIIQGWIGSELTELGHKQAKEFADSISETPQVIFYSDLNRAKQTVDALIAKFPDVPIFADWRLRESSFGLLEGTSGKDIDWQALFDVPPDEGLFGSEPVNHLQERVKSFMRDVALIGVSHAVVITHGGTLNQFKFILDKNHAYTRHANTESFDIEYSFDNPNLKPGKIPKWSINA